VTPGSRPRVVVTGGGERFGTAIARAFGRAGARVAVADANAAAAQAVAGSIEGAVAVPADVRSASGARSAIQTSIETLGGLDILVNAVHGAPAPGPALEMSVEDFDAQIILNVRSMFLAVKYAIPHLGPGSVIVNLASTAHRRPRPMLAAYNASVGSLITMTRALAAELGPRIRVNAVCVPGPDPGNAPGRQIPMGREVTDHDVAEACLFLAAPRSGFLTGVCLEVNGGADIE
jgi:3-oxoacyl-[acyl-carrier protein] reductase